MTVARFRYTIAFVPSAISLALEPTIEPLGTLTPRSLWVLPLPKVELHLHLEGSMRPSTVLSLSRNRWGWEGPLEPGWESSYYTYTDFAGFMQQLTPRKPWEVDEFRRIAAECFEDLAARKVIYAEVSFDAPVNEVGENIRFWPIMEALEEERRKAEDRWPMRINYIVGLMRSRPVEVADYRVRLAAEARDRGMGVVAVDLHGDEREFPPGPFAGTFALARELGLATRAHAGEARGPESVWDAINALGTTRIGHGVRAVEDFALLERLRSGDITFDMCPTSNIRTGIIPSICSHPIRLFYDMGIPVTVSSDDPLPFFTDVEREYRLLVEELDFRVDDLREVTLNALRAAFLPERERQTMMTVVDGAYQTAEQMMQEPA